MNVVIVPLGFSEKVVLAANEAGATGATILRARGANASKHGLFSLHIEPEKEMILITATKEVTKAITKQINEEFTKTCNRGGSVYILPVEAQSFGV